MKKYTKKDVGCFADGAFGHEHIRDRLHDLLEGLLQYVDHVVDALTDETSDDMSEEDEALELLNLMCEDGIHFELIDGDLVLIEDEKE